MQQNVANDRRPIGGANARPILGIQYLRGIACIAVVVFHVLGGSDGTFYVGQAGVDVFFLISGFIMWTVTARREQAPGKFLVRRVIRVVPLYWSITLVVFARRYVIGTATLSDLFYSLSFIPHRMSDGVIDPIIVPGWTLNFEMFFYLIFALCLAISVSRRLLVATAILLPLVILGFVFDPQSPVAAAYTSPLLLEFLVGACIGHMTGRAMLPAPIAGSVILFASVAAFCVQQIGDARLVDWRVLSFGLPAAGILIGTLSLERLVPEYRWLNSLGDASYAIYLVHVPVMSLLLKVQMPLPLRLLVVTAVSVAVGTAFHLLDLLLKKAMRARSVPKPIQPAT